MSVVAFALVGVGACSLVVDTSGLGGAGAVAEDASLHDATDIGDDVIADAPAEVSVDAPERDRYFEEVMSDGPIAYFRLSDTTPAAKNEVAGSAIGAFYPASGVTRVASGALSVSGDGALRFDDLDAMFSLFGPVDFPGDVPFTVEAWLKLDDFTGLDIASDMSFVGAKRTGWTMFLMPNAGQFELRAEMWNDGVHFLYTQHKTPVTTASFHHVVFFHSDVDRLDHLVVDGNGSDEGITGNGFGLRATNSASLSWGGFRGTLDELAIYDKVLSQERILKHFHAR